MPFFYCTVFDEMWVSVGFPLFFHSNYWALHLFIPKQTAAAAAAVRSTKDVAFCGPRGISQRTGNEKGIGWITIVLFKWEWKVEKLAFIYIKILGVIAFIQLLSWVKCKHAPVTTAVNHRTGSHMGLFKIWYSVRDIKVYGYVGVFL